MSEVKDAGRDRYQWVTTNPNPLHPGTGWDAGQRGWRLHLARLSDCPETYGKNRAKALCGMRPAHGWGLDLFIDEACARCEDRAEKLGIETPKI